MIIKAEQKYLRASPQKLRIIVRALKGIGDPIAAVEHLQFVSKKGAKLIAKVIKQAMANAKDVNTTNLYIKEVQINDGPTLKRWSAGARGMAKPILKRSSHIRVILEVKEEHGAKN